MAASPTFAEFKILTPQRASVSGALLFSSAANLLRMATPWFTAARARSLEVDLTGVNKTDSAGLALLVAWCSLARRHGCSVRFLHAPSQIVRLARVNGLDKLLPLDQNIVSLDAFLR